MTTDERALVIDAMTQMSQANQQMHEALAADVANLLWMVRTLRGEVERLRRRPRNYARLPEHQACPVIDLRTRVRIA